MTKLLLIFATMIAGVTVVFTSSSLAVPTQFPDQATKPLPNILLIVADDMGYSDAGCFGGEIDTPSIDSLATNGVRFTNFFVNPMCVVTRTSLLSGHEHSQSRNYKHSLPIAKLLQRAGYHTSISGKWHQPGNPLDAGFESFYGFLKGEINGWKGTYSDNKTLAIQTNREPPRPVAGDWYCSDAFAGHAIDEIDAAIDEGKPFFTYVPFNAPHGPLHAPQENVEKYSGRFDAGWDQLRKQRMARMKGMGLIDERFQSNTPEAEACIWNELPEAMQETESRRFCAYAGMVDRMDQNIGRLLAHLDERKVAENTIVIFFSDNGGNYSHGAIQNFAKEVPWAKNGPRPACATGWGRLMNTPFSWYKTSAFRGGVSAPLIIRWPQKSTMKSGAILHHRLHVSDLYPTLLEIVDMEYPDADGDRPIKPLYGKSMLPVWEDPALPEKEIRDEIFWGFNETTKGLLSGDWKIVSINDSPWKLYDLKMDPAESADLSMKNPDKVRELNDAWYEFAENEAQMDRGWMLPLRKEWQGWGLHRVRMTMPIQSISPACSALDVPLDTALEMTFRGKINFSKTEKKSLRLYSTRNPSKPVWEFDPDVSHPAQGQNSIRFELPALKPATTYYLLSDNGWINVAGKPAVGLNDGAFFYRFRTADE